MAAERNTRSKNALAFGKATMYVISERGLQTEPCIHSKAADSKIFLDKAVFSGKKVNFSQTKSVDFSWKEIANASKQDNKMRVLNLNELAVDDNMNTLSVSSGKTRYFTGATSQSEHPNRRYMCFNASKVNDRKQFVNDENQDVTRLSSVCHDPADGFEKGTTEGNPERGIRREAKPPYSHYIYSLTSGQTFVTSRDLTNTGTLDSETNDSETSSPFPSDSTIQGDKSERPGKCYLKRIFYSKGNPHYSKPSNLRRLPQISRMTENYFTTSQEKDILSTSSNRETTEENKSNKPRSNKLLLPLNINVLKNSEKQKHHLKSIVKLPTVVDNSTGQVHLSLEAVAFEQSDYNKWSRRQKRVKPENTKISCLSFPLIAKSSR